MITAARFTHAPGPIAWLQGLFRRSTLTAPRKPAGVPARGAAAKALLRVYRGQHGHWCVRRENGPIEAAFAARIAAIEFARLIGMAAGSYRILFETPDGSLLEERLIPS
jgi:hypothetical protein